jgi:hypothetical protein
MPGYASYANIRQARLASLPDAVPARSARRHEMSAKVPQKPQLDPKRPFPDTNWVPWIFAAKTTASALIALLVAFTFNLDQPYWHCSPFSSSRHRSRAGRFWRRASTVSSGL